MNFFLDRGAAVNAPDSTGRTPLIEAVFGGHLSTLEELLKRGADVNAQDADGWTALMEAASKGRADVVRILLAHGADARIKNKKGWTRFKDHLKVQHRNLPNSPERRRSLIGVSRHGTAFSLNYQSTENRGIFHAARASYNRRQ